MAGRIFSFVGGRTEREITHFSHTDKASAASRGEGSGPPKRMQKVDEFTCKWGQNWGIPFYGWAAHREDVFRWWRQIASARRDRRSAILNNPLDASRASLAAIYSIGDMF